MHNKPEQFFIGDRKGDAPPPRIQPAGKLVKEKTKTRSVAKQKSAGVSQQGTVPDHQEKLTKHRNKTIIVETKEEDKPEPHVQPRREIDYVKEKQKGVPVLPSDFPVQDYSSVGAGEKKQAQAQYTAAR